MMQVIKQTDKEKMKMYMKVSKKKLIQMLIQCNKIVDMHYETPFPPTCGDCGKILTEVRPGKHQCDNNECIRL